MNQYFVYIITNPSKTVLYVGMTNDLSRRLIEHFESRGNTKTFAGRYYCHRLVYYEIHNDPMEAIMREKEIKKWGRSKKDKLISKCNPSWHFMNGEFM